MSKFYTQYKRPDITPTNAGNRFLEVYQEEITKEGSRNLVPIGKTNVYDRIQEDLESTKIENILKAVALGDYSALKTVEPVYIDATTFPKTLMEAQNIVVKAKQQFETFPPEVREQFDNDPEKYCSMMGTKEFLEKMSPYNNKLKAVKEAGDLAAYNKKVADQAKFEADVAAAKGGLVNES